MVTAHEHPEIAREVYELISEELKLQFEQTNSHIADMATKADVQRLEERLDAIGDKLDQLLPGP